MEHLSILLPTRDALAWGFIAAAVLAGGALRGLTGFGAALVMAPLLSLVVSARETLCLVTLLSAVPIGQGLFGGVARQADRGLLAPMIAAAGLGLPLGIWLIGVLPAPWFGRVIGAAVILSALVLLAGLSVAARPSLRLSLGVGALSGVLTGFGGVGGPPAILYVLGVEPDAGRARASFIVFFAWLYPVALAALVLAGMLRWAEVLQGLLLVPVFLLGGKLGEALFRHLDRRYYRSFVLVLLIVAGGMAAMPHAVAGTSASGACDPLMVRPAPQQCLSVHGDRGMNSAIAIKNIKNNGLHVFPVLRISGTVLA